MREVASWDTYYLGLARQAASRSKDPRTQVGAVIVSSKGRVLSLGYNGFPEGVPESEQRWTPEHKHDFVIHAELNAIANAASNGVATEGAILYVTLKPCLECAKAILAAGITHVFYDLDNTQRRGDFCNKSDRLLLEAGAKLFGLSDAD